MKIRLFPVAGVLLIAVLGAVPSSFAQNTEPAAGAAKRSITERDLFDFVWVADPQISPDGSRVIFTRVVTDEKHTGYETSIWIVAAGGGESPARLTNGKHDARARWSPDGSRIAFVRSGEKDDSGKPRPPQIAILPLTGGEAHVITDLPKGASGPIWSPDGKRIAFSSSTTLEDIEKEQRKKSDAKAATDTGGHGDGKTTKDSASTATSVAKSDSDADRESDIHIITQAVYRDNDEGYLDLKRHDHIWVVDVPRASDEPVKPLQITSGDYDEGEIVWTRDGSHIYFATSRIDEPYYETPSTDLYSVAATSAGATPEKLASIPMGIYGLSLSPDGK